MIGRSIRFALVFLLLTGLVYPLATTGIAHVLFPRQAGGSLIANASGQPVGSALIGQEFTGPGFFHGRLSSIKNDASASGSPNYGPTDQALLDRVKADVANWQKENPGAPIPADLLTNSGSGVDPHISPEAASAQITRISGETGIPPERLTALVVQHTEGRTLGLFGEPRVNVLEINLALQALRK